MAIKGKKGYFFTLMVVISLALVFMYFTMKSDAGQTREVDVAGQRLVEINRFLDSLEKDAESAVHVGSFRSFLELQNKMITTHDYISDSDDYKFLILDGVLDGGEPEYLDDSALIDWERRMVEIADQLRLRLSFEGHDILLTQDNAWEVKTVYSFNITLQDDFSNSVLKRNVVVESSLPLSLLYDPIYLVETGLAKTYVQDNFVYGDEITGDTFMTFNRGPSYLSRLEGDIGANEFYGIENLVNVQDVGAAGVIYPGRSIIDWQYFGTGVIANTCSMVNYPDWAVLDVNFANTYAPPPNCI